MTNYIVLEGLALYVFLVLFIVLMLLTLIGFFYAVAGDSKRDALRAELRREREINIGLNRDNMRLKLKCGELRVGEKVDV